MQLKQGLKQLLIWGGLISSCLGLMLAMGLYLYFTPRLPPVEQLRNIQLQTPLRIFSADEKLIAEFGEKRRSPVKTEDVPPLFIKAFLAAEDDRFQEHFGIDIKGLMRAAVQLISTGSIQSGGSTITMQVAKNYFLTRDRTFTRKFNEILLALEIEQELTKAQILELYINKIYLGKRAYGIQAASQVYYGKPIDQLTLAQFAMIAAMPKAPSSINPLVNPERALVRRDWILNRMYNLDYIDNEALQEALSSPISARYYGQSPEVEASYIAEMARSELLDTYNTEELYTGGFKVYTTVDSRLQSHANLAMRAGLMAYDRRHGYRGAEQSGWDTLEENRAELLNKLRVIPSYGPLKPAVVLEVPEVSAEDQNIVVLTDDAEEHEINWPGIKWARPYLSANAMGPFPKTANEVVAAGDLIRIIENEDGQLSLSQVPNVGGALIAIAPENGAIISLVGGFSYNQSKFNRAVQATRQPGSNFKPFLYSAALEQGYTASSLINDAPVVFEDDLLESAWRPENFSGKFYGPTRLRPALFKSRNLVSIRLLRALGIPTAINYVERFGFPEDKLPRDLSLALGSAEFTPLEIANGYAILANGGYRVEPFLIDRVEDSFGNVLYQHVPFTVCPDCASDKQETAQTPAKKKPSETAPAGNDIGDEDLLSGLAALELGDQTEQNEPSVIEANEQQVKAQEAEAVATITDLSPLPVEQAPTKLLPAERVVEERAAFILDSILKDVIKRGTGRRARSLGRSDLAGKTGTTNDQKDAWFSGYQPNLATTVWVGFDQPATLGKREVGGYAALPIWIDYMREALKDEPQFIRGQPEGLVSVRIDPKTGLLAAPGQDNAVFEIYREEFAPTEMSGTEEVILPEEILGGGEAESSLPEQLF